jgi:uncharacterized membrane protein YhaH (DUF805 family)
MSEPVKARKPLSTALAEFLSFRGRATGAYVLSAYLLLLFASAWISALLEFGIGLNRELAKTGLMLLIIPSFVRRMHDNGRSGWWAAVPTIGLVPRVGEVDLPLDGPAELLVLAIIPFFFWGLYLLAQASESDPERFGPDPRLE